jgi:hypothetical protein
MNKFFTLTVFTNLCLLCALSAAFAQSPCDQTQVTLSSQADVDSFPSKFCSTLCSLTIKGNDITNLDSLYVLTKVGTLRISFNPMLTNVNGLSNLTSIESPCGASGLQIDGNNLLGDLNGLSSLTSITGALTITSNTMLSNLDGLSNVSELVSGAIMSNVTIGSNASLENINGLSKLTNIPGSLSISGNPGLGDINGLGAVTNINGDVGIGYNDALTTLGLTSLEYVQGFLTVEQNSNLVSIQPLSKLHHIGQFSASGMALTISSNNMLASLDGLQALDTIAGTTSIENNEALMDLNGLSLRSVSSPEVTPYNTGIRIAGNTSLRDMSALANLQAIDGGRTSYLEVESNPQLTAIQLPNLKRVGGYFLGRFTISDNPALANLNGLSGLQMIKAGYSVGVTISRNGSLQDINGLSSLVQVSGAQGYSFSITDNANLGSFCGLYNLFQNKGTNCGSAQCYSTQGMTISGNETNPTPDEIIAEGPCGSSKEQPRNLVFSNVTSEGMRVTFNRPATFASGYLVLMKAYSAPAPEDQPEDGQTYHVGQVLGSSSIVVHTGSDTTFTVSGLVPSTPYYFDIFAWKTTSTGNDYLTTGPLEGHQSTLGGATVESSITFTDVTSESMTVALTNAQPGNYITLMKAFGSPSPNDVPVNGTEYHVGNTIGSSTIVVNIGDGSAFNVAWLQPGITYYFDMYRYEPTTHYYDAIPYRGNQKTSTDGTTARMASADELTPYPNPFVSNTTIPFVVEQDQTVQVAIYDMMGKEIGVLATGSFEAGRHEANWDGVDKTGRRVDPGVYVYSVRSESGIVTGRVAVR